MKKRTVEKMLTDPSTPMEMRLQLMRQVCQAEEEIGEKILINLLEAACQASAGKQFLAKTEELAEVLKQLEQGCPTRSWWMPFAAAIPSGSTDRAAPCSSTSPTQSPSVRKQSSNAACPTETWR
jgi:hypothetical protein